MTGGIETLYSAKLQKLEQSEITDILIHYRDWQKTLRAKDALAKSINQQIKYAGRFIHHEPAITRISQLTKARAQLVLGSLKAYGPTDITRGRTGPSSHKTLTDHVKYLKMFTSWLVEDGRMMDNSVQYLKGYRLSTDRRHDRADLSAIADQLLAAAYSGPTVRGVSGKQRFWLYYAAINTGLRASEIRRLCPRHCRLAETVPLICLSGNENKGKRKVQIVLRRDFAADLAQYIAGKPPEDACFNFLHPNTKYSLLVYADLHSLGISRTDPDGLFRDFHALRHTYSSRLGATGADIKTLQSLMRHTDPKLTMRYTHTDRAREVAAVEALSNRAGSELARLSLPSSPSLYPHGDLNPGHLAENQTATDTAIKLERPIVAILQEATNLPTAALRALSQMLSEELRRRVEVQ